MQNEQVLTKGIKTLLFIILSVVVLYYGKPFLVPLIIAALLSMLLLPLSEKLEKSGWKRSLSILVCVLLLIAFFALIISLLSWQASEMAKDATTIERNVSEKISQFREFLTSTLGISEKKQQEVLEEQQQSGTSKISGFITGAIASIGGFLAHFILVLVYIFLFLYYRTHIKEFLFRIVPKESQKNARVIVDNCRQVAQKYLTGLAIMIATLWVMYSIGFSIAGVKNSFFFAILCGLLEIVPFVGNLVGVIITLVMSIAQGGDAKMIIGILISYGVVQFVQTYLLEPLVVGRGVDINPLFTIAGLVAGEIIWGIPGMILAIPLMAIAKIIFDHVEPLKPYGELLGEKKKPGKSITEKIKKIVKG